MYSVKLVELDGGLRVYASSTMDAQFIHREIFGEGCYDDVRLPTGACVVDVGAHIGLFLLLIKSRWPDAEVLAFEPSPESAQVLRQNIELHELPDVTVFEVALGRAPEAAAPFSFYPMAPSNSTRYPEEKARQKEVMARTMPAIFVEKAHRAKPVTVRVERLAEFLPAGRTIDLLKIDVEGGELDVLHGIDPPQWSLIQQVLMEVQDLDGRLATVQDLLRGHGFDVATRLAPMVDPDIGNHVVHAVRP